MSSEEEGENDIPKPLVSPNIPSTPSQGENSNTDQTIQNMQYPKVKCSAVGLDREVHGVRMKKCSCKVFRYPLMKNRSQTVMLVEEDTTIGATKDNDEKLNMFLRLFEHIYDKCIGYNLRYCPLRGKLKRGKPLANVARDMFILIWFFVANFIVLLNITARIAVQIFFLFKEIAKWLERIAHDVVDRNSLNSHCEQTLAAHSSSYPD